MITIPSFVAFFFETGIYIHHQQLLVCKFFKPEKKTDHKKKEAVLLNFKDQMEKCEFWKEFFVMKVKKHIKLASYFLELF